MYPHSDKLLSTGVYTESVSVNHSPSVCSMFAKMCSSGAELGVSGSNKSQTFKMSSVKQLSPTFRIKTIQNYGEKGMQEP